GIETLGGVMTRLIPRNTTIPTRRTQIFSTASDNQPAVSVHVMQGERELSRDNRTLGRFDLVGIPPAPRGVPQIEVTFDIDANGIVKVSAKDLGTGRQQEIAIKVASGLSEKEVQRMIEDAEQHAEEDKQKRVFQEVVNQADILVYSTESTLKDFAERFSQGDLAEIKNALAELHTVRNSEDRNLEAVREATNRLQTIMHRFAELMYSTPDSGDII
ncbi:MAG TPA: Hsp70 family protein, partial [Candidatus Krumholzibacteria bacterium]|nr:Hsp70 family protein [Candidatus Krumholzibacteria bacterium]